MKKTTLHELANDKTWEEAVIVFTEDTFDKPYTELERSYKVNHDCRYFDPSKIANSIFGNCLDGIDIGVRLDHYIYQGWEIDYCYITKHKEGV